MDYAITTHPASLEVSLSGQFTFNCNPKFKQLMEMLGATSQPSIAINLKGVEFIDSSGLGMLLLLRDECMKKNVTLSLHEPQGQVRKILNIAKFDQLFSSTL